MKKIMGTILLVLSILFCITGLQVCKNASYTNLLYYDNTAILIRADEGEDKLVSFINEKMAKECITISKYAYVDDDSLVIYTNDFTLGNKIYFDTDLEIDDESFIANYEADNQGQLAQFYLFGSDQQITIFPIEQIRNDGTDGLYYVKNEFADQITQEINFGIGFAEVYNVYSVNIESYLENCSEMIMGIGMTIIILIISTVHYMVRKSKKIAILKIHGFSVNRIVSNILKELLITQIVVLVIGAIGISVYGISVYGMKSMMDILRIYLVSYVISSLIYSLTSIIVLFIVVTLGKTVPMLKGKRPYKAVLTFHMILKSFFLAALLVGCINLAEQMKSLKVRQDNLKIWSKAEDVYSIGLNYVGESREAEERLQQFYALLEQQGGFLIDAQNYIMVDERNHLYDYNAPGEESYYDPYGRTITVNENYLRINPITINGELLPISEMIVYDDKVRNILVPENLSIYEDEIKARFLEDFHFKKVQVENIYNEKTGKSLNNTTVEELTLNIIYIDQGQEYFPYANIEVQSGCRIFDPIVVLETGNIDCSYYTSYLSRCVFFEYEGINAFNSLLPIIEKSDSMSEIQGIMSVYNNYGQVIYNMQVRRNYLITALSVTMILFFVSGYLIISSYFQEKKYQIYVKKVFGFSLIQCIYKFVLLLFMMDIVVLVFIAAIHRGTFIIMIGAFVVFIDMLLILAEGNQLDKKNFNIIIKGEH